MDTCQFSYISLKTNLPTTALGVERAWDSLKAEFNRSGPGIPGANYYKTISFSGPQLFAVLDENRVFYHDYRQWHRYITATDVKFGQMDTTIEPRRATTEDETPAFSDASSLEDKYSLETDN